MVDKVAVRIEAELAPLSAALARAEKEARALGANGAASVAALEQEMRRLDTVAVTTSRGLTGTAAAAQGGTVRIGQVGAAAKLTSDQMLNLSRQGNDVVTMFALGAAPMQIFASQAGQIYDALEQGPNGIRGSLAGIGQGLASIFTPARIVTAALLAAGAAAVYFSSKGYDGVAKAEKALASYDDAVKRVSRSMAGLSDAAQTVFDREMIGSPRLNRARLQAAISEQQRAAKAMAGDILREATPRASITSIPSDTVDLWHTLTNGNYRRAQEEIYKIALGLKEGSISAAELQERLAEWRFSSDLPESLQSFIDGLITTSELAREAEARLKALTEAQAELMRQNKREIFGGAIDSLNEFITDTRSAEQRINDAYSQATAGPSLLDPGQIAELGRLRNQALAEIEAREQTIRAGHALDLQSLNARSAAQQRLIAEERERLALAQEFELTTDQRETRIREAGELAYAQAIASSNEALHQRVQGMRETLAGYDLEIASIGRTDAEIEGLEVRFALMAAAREAAFAEGREVYAEEITWIEKTAAAAEEAVAKITRLQLAEDSGFDRSQLFLSDREAAIASRLRGTGLGLDSEEAAYLRRTSQLEEYRNLNREVWTGIGNDIIQNGVKPLEALGNALQNLAGKFLDRSINSFADSIFNSLFGGENAGTPSAGASNFASRIPSIIGKAVNDNFGTATVIPVQRSALAAVNDNLSAYAKAIQAVESGGRYNALGPVTRSGDRAYGAYQVMGNNIPEWSRAAIGRELTPNQFLGDRGAQDAIFNHRFGGYVNRYGNPQDAASAWFTGGPLSSGANRSDILGTTGSAYVDKFNAALSRVTDTAGRTATGLSDLGTGAVTGLAQASGTAAQGLDGLGSGLDQFGRNLSSFAPQAGGASGGGFFSRLFGGFGGGGGGSQWNLAASGAITGLFADGTNFAPGGWAVVGERGPEVVNLPRGSQVIPNHKLNQKSSHQPGQEMGGGRGVVINQTLNMTGVLSAEDASKMATTAGQQAVQTVKDNLPGWQFEIRTFGQAS